MANRFNRIFASIVGRSWTFQITWKFQQTGYKKPMTKEPIPTLLDALCEAFDRSLPGGIWEAKGDETFCNEAVNFVCVAMGYKAFSEAVPNYPNGAKMANQMYDAMAAGGDWLEVDGPVAQSHANHGSLVIAAQKNSAGHGHVCTVRPGTCGASAKWGVPADKPSIPKVMNVGKKEFRFIGRGANWAFAEPPKYFVLKASA